MASPGTVQNAFSVDVEDWYQVSDFEAQVPHEEWDRFESRVVPNTRRILDLLDEYGVDAAAVEATGRLDLLGGGRPVGEIRAAF